MKNNSNTKSDIATFLCIEISNIKKYIHISVKIMEQITIFFYSLGAPKFKSNPIKKYIIVFLGTNILHIYFDLYKLNIVTKTKLEKNGKKMHPIQIAMFMTVFVYLLLLFIWSVFFHICFDHHKSNFMTKAKFVVALQD